MSEALFSAEQVLFPSIGTRYHFPYMHKKPNRSDMFEHPSGNIEDALDTIKPWKFEQNIEYDHLDEYESAHLVYRCHVCELAFRSGNHTFL